MERFLVAFLWVAVFRATCAAEQCKPKLEIKKQNLTSVTLKWSCSNEIKEELKDFVLYPISDDAKMMGLTREEETGMSQGNASRECTLPIGYFQSSPIKFYIKAIHQDKNVVDQSEVIEVSLSRCRPVLSLQQETLNDITVKWECKNAKPEEVNEYQLRFHKFDMYMMRRSRWTSVNIAEQETTLTNLTCGATYVLFVKATYNGANVNDYSNVLEVKLGGPQNNPKKEDVLEVEETSVTLKLDQFKSKCPMKSFKMSLRGNTLSKENRTEASEKQFVFDGLSPNTEYTLVVQTGDDSRETVKYIFRTACEKTKVPVALHEKDFLDTRHKYFVLRLEKWACVDSFAVEYRVRNNDTWNLVSSDVKPEQRSVLIQRLIPGTTYFIRVNATNSAGTTVGNFWMEQAGNVCGDWLPYGEKCVKDMKEAGLLSKNEAQAVCERFKEDMETPTLYIVRHETHQKGLASLELTGPVWLGLHSDDGEVFQWDDGSEVGFSSWANQSVQDKEHRCAQMKVGFQNVYPEDKTPMLYERGYPRRGHRNPFITWERVSCSNKNYVVCEKPKPKPLAEFVEGIENRLTEVEKKFAALEKKN